MKIIDVVIIETYTCQVCQRWFTSKQELIIIPYVIPLCKRCERDKIIEILWSYDKKTLDYLIKYYSIEKLMFYNLGLMINKICDKFLDSKTANIKEVVKFVKFVK